MTTPTQYDLSRRNFLKVSAAATVLGALSSTQLNVGTAFAQEDNQQLLDILNYALTLEHLEATAYRQVLGTDLLTGRARDYFQTFGDQEAAHVQTLTQVIQDLGGTPVSAQENYDFPNFQNEQDVLEFFHMVEDLGAAAYLGQVPRIERDPYLTTAVAIHNVEGQHAAALADLIGQPPAPAFAEPKTMEEVLQVVRPLLQADMEMPSEMPSTGLGGAANAIGVRFSR